MTSPPCTPPDTLVGGGFDVSLGHTPGTDWLRSAPKPNGAAGDHIWQCRGVNSTAFNVNIRCFARCCHIPGR